MCIRDSRYTDKVYDFAWIDDFSAARNFAAAQASNNWILVLDCDEYLTQLDEKALRICMQQHLRHVGMMGLTNVYTQPDGEHAYKAEEVPRFYNRNFFEYRFRIHEQITPKNQVNLEEVCLSTYRLPVEVEHHGYDITPEEMERKQARNLTMLQSALGAVSYTHLEPGTKVQEQTTAQAADKEVEVSISDVNSRKSVLSDDELNVALENVLASQSNILDVDKADDMIRAANRRILENANDSVLAQANQSSDVVKELCK